MGDTEEETLPFHMHTTAPGGVILEERTTNPSGFLSCRTLIFKFPTATESGLREVEGAGFLHCSLKTALENKSCRASEKALRHHASVTGLPQPVPAAHLPQPLLPRPLQCSNVLLLPSTQPNLYFKGHLYPMTLPHPPSRLF